MMRPSPRAAFSQVEVLLAIALYAIIVTGVIGVLALGQRNASVSGERGRAVALAEEGLEVVSNLRNQNFSNLTDGTYGLALSGSQWILSGTSDVTGVFTRQITIATVDAHRKRVTAQVTWQQDPQRTGNVSLVSYLSDWHRPSATPSPTPTATAPIGGAGSNLGIDIDLAKIGGPNTDPPYSRLRRMTLTNTGNSNITITKIKLTWVDLTPTVTQKITSIRMQAQGTPIWDASGPGTPTGPQPSGTELDVTDYTLNKNTSRKIRFWFDNNMVGTKFTIVFTMSDGTTKVLTNFIPPPCDAAYVDCTATD